jgi:hypothetical protein
MSEPKRCPAHDVEMTHTSHSSCGYTHEDWISIRHGCNYHCTVPDCGWTYSEYDEWVTSPRKPRPTRKEKSR